MSAWKSTNFSGRTFKAVITFKVPKKPLDHWVPKDVDAWNEFVAGRVGKLLQIQALTKGELKQIVRKSIELSCEEYWKEEAGQDPSLPKCYYWSEEQVGSWLNDSGLSYLVEVFKRNRIDGRKLIRIDNKFLNLIGLKDLNDIKGVHLRMRKLLGLDPYFLEWSSQRSSSDLEKHKRKVKLLEKFLWKKSHTGRRVDSLTFKEFCSGEGFDGADLNDS